MSERGGKKEKRRGKKGKKESEKILEETLFRERMKRKETTRIMCKERTGQNSTKSAKAREQSYS